MKGKINEDLIQMKSEELHSAFTSIINCDPEIVTLDQTDAQTQVVTPHYYSVLKRLNVGSSIGYLSVVTSKKLYSRNLFLFLPVLTSLSFA